MLHAFPRSRVERTDGDDGADDSAPLRRRVDDGGEERHYDRPVSNGGCPIAPVPIGPLPVAMVKKKFQWRPYSLTWSYRRLQPQRER